MGLTHCFKTTVFFYIYNNNNPIYKAPKALASEALAAGQSWVLIKVRLDNGNVASDVKCRIDACFALDAVF